MYASICIYQPEQYALQNKQASEKALIFTITKFPIKELN